jgi:5-(carboxyamino)imidazole ribonucleotide synthase
MTLVATPTVVPGDGPLRPRPGRPRPAAVARPPAAPRVGIVGGGQLARMTHLAALPLGITVTVLESDPVSAAGLAGARVLPGRGSSLGDLAALAQLCDVVTLDREGVPIAHLRALEAAGVVVAPGADVAELAADEVLARRRLAEHGYPVASANATVDVELSVLVARSRTGEVACYDPVATVRRDGRCAELVAPAPVAAAVADEARRLASSIAERLGLVGIMAVELFLVSGDLVVNELAARPHDSGHHTIEAAETSQFEQHLRAVLGWPLGPTGLRRPAAVTCSVLGAADGGDPRRHLARALAEPGAHVHLYDERARPGRTLGHVTVLADTVAEAAPAARRAAATLGAAAQALPAHPGPSDDHRSGDRRDPDPRGDRS